MGLNPTPFYLVVNATSSPIYPHKHEGPVLVCGSAWGLADDLLAAKKIYPDAPIIAVNHSAQVLKALAIFTQHPRKMVKWAAIQQARFGEGFTTHAAGTAHVATKLGRTPEISGIDYWWDGVACGGTSGWGARRLAHFMGFELVVLCGIPIEVGGYYDGAISKSNKHQATIRHYQEQIKKDTLMHDNVKSMSGWTKKFFGGI